MQTVKNRFRNKRYEYLKSICQDTNLTLLLKQPKNLYRELTSCSFISNFQNRKPETYKCSDKRCKICENSLNKTNKFTMVKCQMPFKMIYPLKCKMCNKKETYIGETIGDHTEGFKVRISQYMSDCKTGVST